MAGGPRIKAASARSHTRKTPPRAPSRMKHDLGIFLFSAAFAVLSWFAYRAIQPPPPNICGTPNGPPVTATRVQLRDGRFLAYKEAGVPVADATHKIIVTHGYGRSRHNLLGELSEVLSEEVMMEHGIYIVGYDRAGYGQSTPYPKRTIKSEAFDIQDLADALGLGPTFYLAVNSIGSYTGYSAMKYIPHRLAGVAMFAPVVNFWWAGLSAEKVADVFNKQNIGDRLTYVVAHYFPWLLNWYMTQRVLPTHVITKLDDQVNAEAERIRLSENYDRAQAARVLEPTQQGKFESQFRDVVIMFATWDEFEPFDLENPFASRKGTVHIWQGDNDFLVPVELQREVARLLPWIQYHEVPKAGHGLLSMPGQPDLMIKLLLSS